MLSAPHLIIVFLVALLVFGPEKLPELARTLSKAMGEFHRLTGDFQETLQREMQQIERDATAPAPGSEDSYAEPSDLADEPASLALGDGVYPSEAGADAAAASAFEGLRYEDASYVASAANGSSQKSEGETSGGMTPEGSSPGGAPAETQAETPAARDSAPETGNSPSDEKPPLAGGAEKPLNDHPTAA